MSKKIITRSGFFGIKHHYDEDGNYLGKSQPGFFGRSTVHFDAKGNRIGDTQESLLAGQVHLNDRHEPVGRTMPDGFGIKTHLDSKGSIAGRTLNDMLSNSSTTDIWKKK